MSDRGVIVRSPGLRVDKRVLSGVNEAWANRIIFLFAFIVIFIFVLIVALATFEAVFMIFLTLILRAALIGVILVRLVGGIRIMFPVE